MGESPVAKRPHKSGHRRKIAPNLSRLRPLKGSVVKGILAGFALNSLGTGFFSLQFSNPKVSGLTLR